MYWKSIRKRLNSVVSVFMVIVITLGFLSSTGCGGTYENRETESGELKKTKKPESIFVMCSGSFLKGEDSKAFEEYLETLLDNYGDSGHIDLEIATPEHSAYYDWYSASGSGSKKPDVILLSGAEYRNYALSGLLWDMSDAWADSKTGNSGRLTEYAEEVINNAYVSDMYGNSRLYGFPAQRGNGCCTYVKAEWLERAGIDKSSIEDKTLTFEEYYNLLKRLKETSGGDYVIASPGLIADEPPYTHYLPEFYQDAKFDFYKNEDGVYVDGFVEEAMLQAITRIKKGIADGILHNGDIVYNTTKAEDAFCSTDPKEESIVLTYWSGERIYDLKTRLNGALRTDGSVMNDELVALKPIVEVGKYVESNGPVWCITKYCDNPEGVFEYFIDTMLDGNDVQLAWQYGVKGKHWDEDTTEFPRNYISPVMSIATMDNDPMAKNVPEFVAKSADFFNDNSCMSKNIPVTDELSVYSEDIRKTKKEILYKVASDPSYSAQQGIMDYKARVGNLMDTVLKSLNRCEE